MWVSQAPLGYRCFLIGCVFVEYDLFYTTNLIQNQNMFLYNFDTVLYQFLEAETSERNLISLNQLLRFSVQPLPLSFFLYSPFKLIQFFSVPGIISWTKKFPKSRKTAQNWFFSFYIFFFKSAGYISGSIFFSNSEYKYPVNQIFSRSQYIP